MSPLRKVVQEPKRTEEPHLNSSARFGETVQVRDLLQEIRILQRFSEAQTSKLKTSLSLPLRSLLVYPFKSHEGIKPHKCHICGKGFVQSYAMKLHLNVHYQKKYICDLCASQFSNKRSLNVHMVKCKIGIAVTRVRAPRGSNAPRKTNAVYKCFADGCERQFTIRSYLGKHLEKSHNMKFDSFETTCHICLLAFDTVGEHAIHVQTHTCHYICELCKKKFKTEEMLRSHMQRMHKEGEDRPFVCQEPDCGAQYKRSAHLRSHQKYKHSGGENLTVTWSVLQLTILFL